jgi:hypothetical protein
MAVSPLAAAEGKRARARAKTTRDPDGYTPRIIVRWDPEAVADQDLLSDLGNFKARARGKRMKYLARLGLLLEAQGALLEGRKESGRLVLPAVMASAGSAMAALPSEPASDRLSVVAPELRGDQGAGLDGMLGQLEEF